ncbi:Nup2p [Saccharomyces cerevisiae YJM1443]|nr:Nup2p [Saccharomyces cerevisiae YJM1443]
MAKRVADAQIQRETYDSNESDDDVTPSTKVASSAVMNRRKIAMPKRRMAFKPFGSAKSDETKQASSFSFLNRADGTGEAQVDNSPTTESNSRLKALNLQFKAKVDDLVLGKPLADLRPLFTRYELYIKNILEAPVKSIENPTQTKGNDAKPAKVEDVQKSSDSSSEDEVKVEGPKFTIDAKPPISDSVFSFGPKKENRKKDESDSENDIEIKGPEFKFSGTVSSDVFKLNPSTDKNEKKTETNAKPFSFSSATSTTEQTKSKNPLSLTEATKTNVDNNSKAEASFTFGTKHAADSQNNKPSFVFGQAAAKPSLEKSSFTFGSTTIEKKNDENSTSNSKPEKSSDSNDSKPSFSFSIPSKNTPDASKPSFNFGVPNSSKNETSKPVFSFGAATPSAKEASQEDDNNNVEKPSSKPAFNFISNAGTEKEKESKKDSKPAFSFGISNGSESKDSDKPSLPSAVDGENDKKEATKPAFSFGINTNTTKTADTKAPTFTFGSSALADNKEDVKKPFSFGTSQPNNTPSFSFGKTTANLPANSSTSPAPSIPSTGFKFSLPFEQKGSQTTTKDSKEESTTEATGNESQDATKVDATPEESKPINLQNGEEDEVALFSQKAKLMTFNAETKSYDSRGVGEMKLLKKKDDPSKVRLLCRSDGMGNVLLNATVVDSFKYEPLAPGNDNLIKAPTVAADGKLVTYIVKFKQKEEGRSFTKAIEDAKKEMK